MEKNRKLEKKNIISKKINLANGRYKDDEIDELYNFVTNPKSCATLPKTIKNSFTSFSSEGKYTRHEETTYDCKEDSSGIRLVKKYQYKDDDGQTGNNIVEINNGREILRILKSIFK